MKPLEPQPGYTPLTDAVREFSRKEKERQCIQMKPPFSSPGDFLQDILDEFKKENLSPRASRLTEDQVAFLKTTLGKYKVILRKAVSGANMDEEIRQLNKLLGTFSPDSMMSGHRIAREALRRWCCSIYDLLTP
jgi:hypothetical protein